MDHQKYEKGINFFKTRLSQDPHDFRNYSELGEFYYLNGQLKDANNIWYNGINKFKHSRSFYRIMISVFGKYGLDENISKTLDRGKNTFGKSFII